MKKVYYLVLSVLFCNLLSAQIVGTWKLANRAGSLAVGPTETDFSWWSSSFDDTLIRYCLFDDSIKFEVSGTVTHYMDNDTWVEVWQGIPSASCNTPVYPHDGFGDAGFTYVYNSTANTLTMNGVGAHIGLPKAINGSELTASANAPTSVTYDLIFSNNNNTMTAVIGFITDDGVTPGYWKFVYDRTDAEPIAPPTPFDVTFTVDMTNYSGTIATGVFINGNFNAWCGDCSPMTSIGNNKYEITVPLMEGDIQYLFTVDGWTSPEVFTDSIGCIDNIDDNFFNRFYSVAGDVVMPSVCFNSCEACNVAITSNDADNNVCLGQSITLTSPYPSGNQWFYDGTAIPFETGTTLTAYNPGNYSVSSGADFSNTVALTFSDVPTLSISSTNLTCNGSTDGTVSSFATGGTGSLTYTWSNGVSIQNQTGLGAGTLSLVVVDANGCSANQSITITEPSAILANTSSTNSSCGNADGSATVIATGGTGSLTYSWSNGSVGSSVTNLAAGNYNITITDSNGCSIAAVVSVVDNGAPSAPTITSDDPNNSICAGETIALTSSSSTMNVWSTGATSNSIDVTSSGTYTLKLVDGNGCQSAIDSVTIIVNPNPNVSAGDDLSICVGDEVTLSGSGAQTYTWDNGVTNGQPFIPTAGFYTVTGTDNNGCQNTDSLLVTISNCVGIEESQNQFVSIYPNPSTGIFSVNLKDLTDVKYYTVIDQLGKILEFKKVNSISFNIDLSTYTNGIYYLFLNSNEVNQYQSKIEVFK